MTARKDLNFVDRAGWLRAAVPGANDGIICVSSPIVGVAATDPPSPSAVLLAGAAGLAAGTVSMAAGEYVSVSSQSDVERADIARERQTLIDTPEAEEVELASNCKSRGLSPATAALVTRSWRALTEKDTLDAQTRDELGLSEVRAANSAAGGLRLGCDLHRGRCRAGTDGAGDPRRFHHDAGQSGCPRGHRCRDRGHPDAARHSPGPGLGHGSHGHHGGGRLGLRGERLTGPARVSGVSKRPAGQASPPGAASPATPTVAPRPAKRPDWNRTTRSGRFNLKPHSGTSSRSVGAAVTPGPSWDEGLFPPMGRMVT